MKRWKQWQILFLWAPKSLHTVTRAMKLKDTCSLGESCDKPRQYIRKQKHRFANKGPFSQSYGFSSSVVWMWELDHKESWVRKNWCFQIVVLKKTLESPLDSKESKPVNPRGNQSWTFVGRTDAEAKASFDHPMRRADSLEKTLMLGKIEGGRRRGRQRMASPTQWTWIWANSGR